MKTKIYLFAIFILLINCNSFLISSGLDNIGVYNDNAKIKRINYLNKEVVFIPMRHLGTEKFYNDVKNKTDSLKSQGYYFLYEKINLDRKNDNLLRKFRKLLTLPISKPNSGYKKILDSLYPNIKYKKKLVDQISYENLGLDTKNSERVDIDGKDLVDYYEKKYGEILLTDCDYKTSVYEKYTKCKEENKIPKRQSDDVLVNFRNDFVVKNIKKFQHQKIAIIYGEEHMGGILKQFSQEGN